MVYIIEIGFYKILSSHDQSHIIIIIMSPVNTQPNCHGNHGLYTKYITWNAIKIDWIHGTHMY